MRTTTTFLLAVMALIGFGFRPAVAAEVKTSKERLSDKAADEQRVDNCRVPVERRGVVVRPACPGEDRPPSVGSGQNTTATPQPR